MNERGRLPLVLRALIACVALAVIGTAAAAAEERVHFNIGAQDLLTALNEFAQQSDQELLFSSEVAAAKRTVGVTGEFLPSEVLRTLLEGTGLGYRVTNENTILIERTDEDATDRRAEKTSSILSTPLVLAQATLPSKVAQQDTKSDERSAQSANGEREEESLGEITVTGSHLRGVETASPLFVFDQNDFEKAGAATAPQFLATLPQNFGGGASEDTTNIPTPGGFNASFGTGVNLRGAGSSSTLVLVNGRRSASAGQAHFVDISMIPLSAVERIEVLTDGASAIYGSDAIGGVVNFIMRKDYDGAETRLRSGATTHGDGTEYQVGQSLGGRWVSGSALLSYEYYQRDSVSSLDRDFSSGTAGPIDFVPRQEAHSAYLAAQQDVADGVKISGDAIYADRNAEYVEYNPIALEINDTFAGTQQYGGSLGLALALGGSWTVDLAGSASVNEIEQVIKSPSQNQGQGDLEYLSEYRLWSADVTLTGDLLRLPSGAAKLAVGGGYRDESFEFLNRARSVVFAAPPKQSLSARAAFAELLLPVVGGSEANPETVRLALSLAGRYERYDEFGSTFDPKFGVRWNPWEALSLRGTYGTSFKAPNVYQINPFNGTSGIANRADSQSSTGITRAVTRVGNNPDLREETATTWTGGAEFAPESVSGFRTELTYFDIDYEDRIQAPGISSVTALNNPIYAGLALRRGEVPDSEFNALVAELLSGRTPVLGCAVPRDPVTGGCPEPVSGINAVIDLRLVNIAISHVSGVDWTLNQRLDGNFGSFDMNLNVSYLLDFERQITELAPSQELVDTATNPVDLRTRASVTWARNGWDVTATLNYTDEYTDDIGLPVTSIDSWTTLDLNIRYDTENRLKVGWLKDTVFSLSVLNALDEDPPFFADDSVRLGYDPSNADPLGRVVSLTLVKEW